MSTELSPLLAAFVEAKNTHDSRALAALFSEDAVVQDEGQEHHGRAAIQQWIEAANTKYRLSLEVTGVQESGTETILSAFISGNFPGSPVELHYHLTIKDGKITALHVEA